VCWFQPTGEAPMLRIVSQLTLERYPAALAPADDPHSTFPVIYEPTDRMALSAFSMPVEEDPDGVLLTWVRSLIGPPGEPVLTFIERVSAAIHDEMIYGERGEEGVQTPAQTVRTRRGTCRDFAWLMIEGLRNLGIAARFVSGYLYDPQRGTGDIRGANATHAWCEVFLPSLGWTEFDPTNGLAESADLIPVAIARAPGDAAPISGTIVGDPGHAQLHVQVDVRLIEYNGAQDQAA
jgi:transglutaminase-like putative cysteine protease